VIAAILFFPLFYFVIEAIDRLVPDPKAIVEDNKGTAVRKDDAFGQIPSSSANNTAHNIHSYDNQGAYPHHNPSQAFGRNSSNRQGQSQLYQFPPR
jgi:hypothetical protein